MHTLFGPWTREDLAVIEVADGRWRVSDLRQRQGDGLTIIGFVSFTIDGYDAVTMPPPSDIREFDDLDKAVDFLADQYLGDARDLEDTQPWPLMDAERENPRHPHPAEHHPRIDAEKSRFSST